MIYFISDFHFCHHSILKYERNEFRSIEEHDNFIIDSYNKVINDNDIVYILGDLGGNYKNKEILSEYFSKLKGDKKIILGNHDKFSKDFYNSLPGVSEVFDRPVYLTKRIVLSHEPIQVTDGTVNIHGHLHGSFLNLDNYINVSCAMIKYKPIKINIINRKISILKKDNYNFLEEWFAKYYVFTNKTDKEGFDLNSDGSIRDLEKCKDYLYRKKESQF